MPDGAGGETWHDVRNGNVPRRSAAKLRQYVFLEACHCFPDAIQLQQDLGNRPRSAFIADSNCRSALETDRYALWLDRQEVIRLGGIFLEEEH